MHAAGLEESDWRVLLKSIEQGKCVLFLGPGVAVDPADPQTKPLHIQLARQLAAELVTAGKRDQFAADANLGHVASVYQREMRPKGRAGLELAVEDFYARYREQTTQLHRDLASLPFSLCIGTTPERFLLNAFRETEGKEPIHELYNFDPDPKRVHAVPPLPPSGNSAAQPLIYELYGSLDETRSLVLTENDLLDFLVSVTQQTPPLHPYVTGCLSDPLVSFLFLGFGFHEWHVRILLHALRAGGHELPSLALESENFFISPQHEETTMFFQSTHAIEFRQLPGDFAGELRTRFEERHNGDKGPPPLPPGAPTVFLCHETRDKPDAERVSRELEGRGIGVWFDKQSLRGGDNWENLIPHVLKKQTDYAVILQSPRMLDKPESYFWQEISFALKRQSGFGPDLRFIIPAVIEPNEQLPVRDLSDIHFIDLTQADGIDALAQTILEDWERRQKMQNAA